jgi:hypothetical protein
LYLCIREAPPSWAVLGELVLSRSCERLPKKVKGATDRSLERRIGRHLGVAAEVRRSRMAVSEARAATIREGAARMRIQHPRTQARLALDYAHDKRCPEGSEDGGSNPLHECRS